MNFEELLKILHEMLFCFIPQLVYAVMILPFIYVKHDEKKCRII
ncbi:unnamed protein product [Larinioides sclopetarius]|uniref:Uncharacterized protein n=1 Tax=Larinioides sclopetarius TaxID=280406 RepID=A0AAV1Z0E2_9ARAC